jgi:hypothetical protein
MNFIEDFIKLKLETISDDNKIKFLNGKAFNGLNLNVVYLNQNVCINEEFTYPTRIAVLQQTLINQCPFDEKPDEILAGINDIIRLTKILVTQQQCSKRKILSSEL